MKRSVSMSICFCLMMSLSVASLWAVWEGNAGIAAASEFPGTGMYARSDMFPKNTIVEIQNLEKEITVRAVITGSSGIAGLVAVLSPDTAAALNIRSGSVSRVRISIPSPVSERPAAGTVVAGSGNETVDPDINPAVAASQANPSSAAVPTSNVTETSTARSDVASSNNTVHPNDSAIATSNQSSPVVPVVATAPAPEPETTAASSALVDTNEPAEPAYSETPYMASADPTVPESSAETATYVPSAIYDEPAIVTPAPETMESTPTETATEAESSNAVAETTPEAAIAETVPESADVALIPAEALPPDAVETVVASDVAVVEPIALITPEPVKEEVAPVEQTQNELTDPVPVIALTNPTTVAVVQSVNDTDLPYVSSFNKGSYYIQIASYSDPQNAKKVLDNFGKKYPVVCERSAGKTGNVVKVFIGPVQKDEYGAVLERFKSLGFKDAFVKKGQ